MECRIAPEVRAEIRGDGRGVASYEDAQNHQAKQRSRFRDGKDVLHRRAELYAEDVDDGKQNDNHDRSKVLRAQADIHIAQYHGSDTNRRDMRNVDQPVRRGNGRDEDAEKFAERHANRRDRAGLNDQE